MNPFFNETDLRTLPAELIQKYNRGECSVSEKELVEALKDLPQNFVQFLTAPVDIPEASDTSDTSGYSDTRNTSDTSPSSDAHNTSEASDKPESEEKSKARTELFRKLAEQAVKEGKTGSVPPEDEFTEPTMGQIWSVRTDLGKDANIGVDVLPLVSSPYIFLLTNPVSLSDTSGETGLRLHKEDRFVEFLPVSLSTEYSDRHDFIVPANNDILGVEFMVETQLLGSCLVSDLAECFGELPEEEEEKVLNLHFFTHGMEYDEELLAKTKTGRENEEKNFFIRDFKEIEFRNLRMIEEPVRALENIIEFSEVVTIPREGYALAAADRNTNIGGLVPKTTRILFENDNLSVKINSYENLGYYFNINIASELLATKSSADKSTATESLTSKPPVSESLPSEQLPPEPHSGKFSFISEKIDDSSVKLEHKDLTPDEYFFPFYSEFTDGFYRLSIVADGKTLWHDEFKILTEKE